MQKNNINLKQQTSKEWAPRKLQIIPKSTKIHTKLRKHQTKRTPKCPHSAPRAPSMPQDRPKSVPKRLKSSPKRPKSAPRLPKSAQQRPKNDPKAPHVGSCVLANVLVQILLSFLRFLLFCFRLQLGKIIGKPWFFLGFVDVLESSSDRSKLQKYV